MMLYGPGPRTSAGIAILAGAALLAGCAAPSPDSARDYRLEYFEIEGWHSAAAYWDADGKFHHCFVSAQYNSGITFEIYRNPIGYSLVLQKPEWSLGPNEVYSVKLSIDDRWSKRLTSMALGEDFIRIVLGFDDEALEAIRRGSRLAVEAQAETFAFVLKDEEATLDRLERCYRENLPEIADDYRNPFAAGQNPFKSNVRSASGLKPSTLKKILERATGIEFRVEPASEFAQEAELVYFLEDTLYGCTERVLT